ncbi:efflux RND transporter periplasmic adaptor subunit [Stenotrophomonas sp. YIM B06876]|uniref:efflux RND transporter periplasmic adaptor subunit n=1 Tax=Stenotrophomonas sp. YIM B06876 TaxID=3060211 RepID=UPI00273A0875|nr:efflux RND transporter periplasmic adaptor subunit [Stenotrophomonas sp. YIM B06876]
MTTDMGTGTAHHAHRRRWRRTLGLSAGAVIAVVALAWLIRNNAGGDRPHRNPAITVGVATAGISDVPIVLDALGTVTPLAQAVVQPQVTGVITRILYREGETVAQGQTLVVIDPRPFELALQQAQGALARDEAQLHIAALTLQRYRVLAQQDSIAGQDVDTQAATLKQLQGTVAADRATLASAQLDLAFSRLVAPIAGRAGLRNADVGSYVTPTTPSGVVTIVQTMPIDVEFALPQDNLPDLQARLARGELPLAVAMDRTRSSTLASGRFLSLDNQVDATTGTIKAKARFDNTGNTLFPGQFVNITLQLDVARGAITVPAAALRTGPSGDFVYRIEQGNRARLQPVQRGPATGDSVSVLKGLAKGDVVVIAGGDQLTDGASVRRASAGVSPAPSKAATRRQGQR